MRQKHGYSATASDKQSSGYRIVGSDASSSVEVESLGDAMPIYVVGDSHVLGFRRLFCRDSASEGKYYTVARYFAGLRGESFFSSGKFFAPFAAALEHDEILHQGQPAHLKVDEHSLATAFALGTPQLPPLLLLCCGDIDLRAVLLRHLKNDYDIILPFDDTYPATGKQIFPFDLCQRFVKRLLDPLIAGARALHDLGLRRTYVHTLPPPSTDEARFAELHGFKCPAATRYKAARLFNHLLIQECSKRAVPVIDIWQEITGSDGYLRPEFELDGVHLARSANLLSLRRLIDHALNNRLDNANEQRYRLLYQMAARAVGNVLPADYLPRQPPRISVEAPAGGGKLLRRLKRLVPPSLIQGLKQRLKQWLPARVKNFVRPVPGLANGTSGASVFVPKSTAGTPWVREAVAHFRQHDHCKVQVSRQLIEKWNGLLDFPHDVGNRHPRLDWAGNTIAPFHPGMRAAVPPQDFLDDLQQMFSTEDFVQFFQDCFGCLVTFPACRPLLSLPHGQNGVGPQNWHYDGCPQGVFRAIIYLTEVDLESGPFQYKDKAGEIHSLIGPAGTMLVFDANRLLHRGCPPKSRERRVVDFVIMPRLPEQTLTVLWPGNNSWPSDPYQYSIEGMRLSPAQENQTISVRPQKAA